MTLTNMWLRGLAVILLLIVAGRTATAADDDLHSYLEVFRSDLNTQKKEVLAGVMAFTADESAAFWPIYREYEGELAAIGDARLAVIERFVTAANAGTLDDRTADEIAERFFALSRDRLDLWRKYYKRVRGALSARHAAQFVQVENQIALFVDLAIASEMPTIRGADSAQ